MPVAHIASAADLTEADAPLLGRLFAVAAELARSEGLDGGYRLVTNVGAGRRPVGRPPPRPPARRPADGLAARMTTPGPRDAGARRRRRPAAVVHVVAIGGLVVAVLLLVLQVLGVGVGVRVATPTIAPTGQAAEVTSALVVRRSQDAAFQVQDPQGRLPARREPRPGERPAPAGPGDPAGGAPGGYVVIYELPSANEADRAGPRVRGRISAAGRARSSTRATRSS